MNSNKNIKGFNWRNLIFIVVLCGTIAIELVFHNEIRGFLERDKQVLIVCGIIALVALVSCAMILKLCKVRTQKGFYCLCVVVWTLGWIFLFFMILGAIRLIQFIWNTP